MSRRKSLYFIKFFSYFCSICPLARGLLAPGLPGDFLCEQKVTKKSFKPGGLKIPYLLRGKFISHNRVCLILPAARPPDAPVFRFYPRSMGKCLPSQPGGLPGISRGCCTSALAVTMPAITIRFHAFFSRPNLIRRKTPRKHPAAGRSGCRYPCRCRRSGIRKNSEPPGWAPAPAPRRCRCSGRHRI